MLLSERFNERQSATWMWRPFEQTRSTEAICCMHQPGFKVPAAKTPRRATASIFAIFTGGANYCIHTG